MTTVVRLRSDADLAVLARGPVPPGAIVSMPLAVLPAVLAEATVAAILDRAVVRLSWPLPPGGDSLLLQAAGASQQVKVAVQLDADAMREVAGWMAALKLPWFALPRGRWREAMESLAEWWLFDAESVCLVEPLATALTEHCRRRLLGQRGPDRYRLLHLPDGTSVEGPWSPSIHATIVSGHPEMIPAADDGWLEAFEALCGTLSKEELAACAPREP